LAISGALPRHHASGIQNMRDAVSRSCEPRGLTNGRRASGDSTACSIRTFNSLPRHVVGADYDATRVARRYCVSRNDSANCLWSVFFANALRFFIRTTELRPRLLTGMYNMLFRLLADGSSLRSRSTMPIFEIEIDKGCSTMSISIPISVVDFRA
jgi:hypothetical protein